MAPATVTVLYPAGADATFNMDYYLSHHMPLAQKIWGPQGLQSWKVIKFGPDSQYSVQATLEFDDISSFQKAGQDDSAKEVLGDVPNFSNKQPVIVAGEVVKTS